MKKLIILTGLSTAMLLPSLVNAVETTQLKINGMIIPSACEPNFTGGGEINYGKMSSSMLNSDKQTLLPEKTTQLVVVCDKPALFSLITRDERSASVVSGLETIAGFDESQKFGLGEVDGNKVGAYSLMITKASSEDGEAFNLVSGDAGKTWTQSDGGISHDEKHIGFGKTAADTKPAKNKTITADIKIVTAIDKGSNLPLTGEVKMNGLATFELIYN